MTDIFTKFKRSEIMRKVKNKNTNIEMALRKSLSSKGLRYRIKNKLFGKPDIVFPKQRIVVFCDGDFWHGKNYTKEKKNYNQFWQIKIATNIKRDSTVNKKLKKEGWRVLRFWKTDIIKYPDKCLIKIIKALQ